MPPAPALEIEELVTQIAEIYCMSLLIYYMFERFYEGEGIKHG